LPFESTTSHVRPAEHPHCGLTPHALLGAARLQSSGAAGSAESGAASPEADEVDSPASGLFGSVGLVVVDSNPSRSLSELQATREAASTVAESAATPTRELVLSCFERFIGRAQ